MIKNEIFKLRITSEEKHELQKLAKQTNKSGASVIRELIQIACKRPSLLSSTKANNGQSN